VTVRKGHNFRSDRWIEIKLLLEFGDALFMQCMRDRYLVMMRSGRARLDERFESAITFDRTVGSRSNFYWSFRMSFSMGWMRDRYLVMIRLSSQAGWTVRKCHNFQSDRWIPIKLLLEFPDALFHGVDEGSILGDDEGCRARLDGRFERP